MIDNSFIISDRNECDLDRPCLNVSNFQIFQTFGLNFKMEFSGSLPYSPYEEQISTTYQQ
jgi:hypothetical protein